jgi:DNA invertase Pin-like site-specific DNA recombinase
MNNSNIRYFLYARRSIEKSDKEEKVASIESQISEMKTQAEREGLRIVRIFQETGSAKEPYKRPEFQEMINLIYKGKADGILCWKIDRLARNAIDEGTIKHLLQKGIVKNIKASDRDWYPDDNVLMASVEFGVATQYSRDLAKHIKRGLKAKVESGHRPCIAPIGYENSRYNGKGKEVILDDLERRPILRKLFDLMLTGLYSPLALTKIANEELHLTNKYSINNKKVSKSNMYRILTNKFYYGQFEYPLGSGNFYQGKHNPIITKEEYDKIQILLGRSGRPKPKTHSFSYTGIMKCGECGGSITAEAKTKKQKDGSFHNFIYYHCTKKVNSNCTQKTIEEKEIDKEIISFLEKIKIPKSFHEWAISVFREIYEEDRKNKKSIIHLKIEKLNSIKVKIDNLVQMRMNNEIDQLDFIKYKSELEKNKLCIENEIKCDDEKIESWFTKVSNILDFSKSACEEFKAAIENKDENKKKAIFSSIGYNHLLLDKKLNIQPLKPFISIEKLVEVSGAIKYGLEPKKTITTQGYNGQNGDVSSLMWRW